MPINERHKLTFDELLFFIMLDNALFMGLLYWAEDLTIPRDRDDLPPEWLGKQVISFQQRLMFCDVSKKRLFRTGRKIFKTGIMEIIFFQRAVLYTGRTTREGLFVTPGEAVMRPWQDRLRTRKDRIPLFKMLNDRFAVGDGIISFKTGYKWWCRIEGREAADPGQSMVGLRAADVMMDEADFADEEADMHRQQSALPDANWVMGGVPRGRIHHNPFRKRVYDKEMKKGWSIHAETTGDYSMWINPIYASEKAREEQVASQGGINTPGYITQILGKDSDAISSSFPIRPKDAAAPYRYAELTEHMLDIEKIDAWHMVIPLPQPAIEVESFVLGLDYGYSPDPTIITVSYAGKPPVWRQLLRLRLVTVSEGMQRQIVLFLHNHYHFSSIAIDAQGSGGPLFHNLQSTLGNLVIPGGLGGKAETDIRMHKTCKTPVIVILDELYCETCQHVVHEEETEPVRIPQKQYLTDQLKNALYLGSQWLNQAGPFAGGYFPDLPYPVMLLAQDGEIDDELGGITEEQMVSGYVKYDYPGNQDHNTDSIRMQMAGILDIRSRSGAVRMDPRNPNFGERHYGGWVKFKGQPNGLARSMSLPWGGRKREKLDDEDDDGELVEFG